LSSLVRGADVAPQIIFITELVTSGTLRSFIAKTKKVGTKVIRRWCRQILEALRYLHMQGIIHRDIKCDNIFINGNSGQVKIGDLGLSINSARAPAQSVIGSPPPYPSPHRRLTAPGTPEFMAPELYEESYTSKVDIYAFGMCILEMLTNEYPYAECENAAQIYRRVLRGEPPLGLSRVEESPLKNAILRCLKPAELRPTAEELLADPLFNVDDEGIPPMMHVSRVQVVCGLTSEGYAEAAADARAPRGARDAPDCVPPVGRKHPTCFRCETQHHGRH
jgi:WNK lysine deficient protein kinase